MSEGSDYDGNLTDYRDAIVPARRDAKERGRVAERDDVIAFLLRRERETLAMLKARPTKQTKQGYIRAQALAYSNAAHSINTGKHRT